MPLRWQRWTEAKCFVLVSKPQGEVCVRDYLIRVTSSHLGTLRVAEIHSSSVNSKHHQDACQMDGCSES